MKFSATTSLVFSPSKAPTQPLPSSYQPPRRSQLSKRLDPRLLSSLRYHHTESVNPRPPHQFPEQCLRYCHIATVSVGGVESSDGATTYFIEDIVGVGTLKHSYVSSLPCFMPGCIFLTVKYVAGTIVQGATVWHQNDLHETCSLDGKGGAACVLEAGEFATSFTGTAIPIFTVGANAAGAGGSGGGSCGSGSSNSSGGGSAPSGGGAARVNGGASVGWLLVGTVAAIVAGMRMVL
ncbi:hypothetical protein B0H13DRAFT_2375150 [Mycena leptocephala]|nr:hypothetical protein B0H13DRAFT_2375150 [Mycena leptocephala]